MWSAIWFGGYLFDLSLASSYLWTQHLFLVDWFSPLVIGSIIWGQLTYNNYSKENKLRLQIKKQFEHYLSPDMVKKLQKNPSLLKLGGERKELTFMFSDIRGFTPISESMKDNPEELTRYVNKFLTAMTTIILKNGGTIDKYMGDCIMAFWNAPLDCKNHRELAVKSAIEMKTKLDQMNKTAEFDPPLKIGIGLNTGDCLVGNMGSEQRFDYSVIGDAVNLASRLEGVSKYYDTTIIISENTADGIDYIPLTRPKGIKFYKVDNTFVKGKKEKVSIFSVH
jgi:adenylate cyclase